MPSFPIQRSRSSHFARIQTKVRFRSMPWAGELLINQPMFNLLCMHPPLKYLLYDLCIPAKSWVSVWNPEHLPPSPFPLPHGDQRRHPQLHDHLFTPALSSDFCLQPEAPAPSLPSWQTEPPRRVLQPGQPLSSLALPFCALFPFPRKEHPGLSRARCPLFWEGKE